MARRSRRARREGRGAEVVSIPVANIRAMVQAIPEESELWTSQFGEMTKAEILVRVARLEMNNRTVIAAVREPDGRLRMKL